MHLYEPALNGLTALLSVNLSRFRRTHRRGDCGVLIGVNKAGIAACHAVQWRKHGVSLAESFHCKEFDRRQTYLQNLQAGKKGSQCLPPAQPEPSAD